MSGTFKAAPPLAAVRPERPRHLLTLHRRTYPLRMLGMGLAGLPLVVVLHELRSPPAAWAWVAFSCLLWPQLAYWRARRAADPVKAELANFVLDSCLAATWVPLMHFTLLPSVVLVTVVTADKIHAGVRGLWLRSLPGMVLCFLVTGWFTGFALRPDTSAPAIWATLPILVIHTFAVSMSSYRLIRRVQRQNRRLEELNQIDGLTGLDSRNHWLQQAGDLLARHQAGQASATLVLLDIDHFKQINDRLGHTVGDDVLRDIARLLRGLQAAGSHAGRLGGDEFVLAMSATPGEARMLAERLRLAVQDLRYPDCPGLNCSISLGLAEPPQSGLGLREWLEAADRALYRAKDGGRNRVEGGEPAVSPSVSGS